jgi:hypothetical protein
VRLSDGPHQDNDRPDTHDDLDHSEAELSEQQSWARVDTRLIARERLLAEQRDLRDVETHSPDGEDAGPRQRRAELARPALPTEPASDPGVERAENVEDDDSSDGAEDE